MLRLLTLVVCLLLQADVALSLSLEGSCAIRFYGDSTLHGFDGEGVCEPFLLESEVNGDRLHLHNADIEVSVTGLKTGISARDKKMRAMFDSDNYPFIRGQFSALDPAALLHSWQNGPPGKLPFQLQIRDSIRAVEATARGLKLDGEQITFTLDFNLSLKSFDLKAPKVLALIRVDDEVRVEVDVALKKLFPNGQPLATPGASDGSPDSPR